MKINIEITGKNPFILSEFYKMVKNYITSKAVLEGIKISITRK